ncbi:hypothetical protein I601_2372 [Nocardioides dokdonensis FR1436]|uniref:DUF2254 domain-containing protein n=2 Tax=Nocardioides TaxID=1839 RepID=A0A1A9GMA3_9ACTN|nr:hypothetical protein I601_2372 [Nocardioides dokdonensis FR1436]
MHRTPVPATSSVEPGGQSTLARRLRTMLRPFWVVPALWSLFAVTLGLLAPRVDGLVPDALLPYFFPGDVEGARSVLSTIAGAMISVTGLVFSNTMVVLQLASSQFSPRVLQTFLEDRVTQHTLGVFTASFVYALTVLRSLADIGGDPVPQVAVTLSFLFVVGAVAMFLAFINHITASVGVSNVLHRGAEETRTMLARAQRADEGRAEGRPDLPDLGHQHVVVAPRSGYLDALDLGDLRTLAVRNDARIEILHPLGTFIVEGRPLAMVHGAGPPTGWDEALHRHVDLARDRSLQQDISFGLRRLVDIAERALSPGINDPTTAIQVVDQLHDLLHRMSTARDPYPVHIDAEGMPRVVTREPTFSTLLDLAVDEIAHWGRDSIQVPRRLREMLDDLEVDASPEHRQTIVAKQHQLAGAAGPAAS